MSATSAISVQWFPHIVDSILKNLCSDYPLIAVNLQTVCRTWQTKIRRRLLTHIWIEFHDTHPMTLRPHPLSTHTFTIGAATSLRRTLDIFEDPHFHPLVLAALQTVQVLDVRTSGALDWLPTSAQSVYGDLQMIRLGPYSDGAVHIAPPSETLVIFTLAVTADFYGTVRVPSKVVLHPDVYDDFLDLLGLYEYFDDQLENITLFYPPQDEARYTLLSDEAIDSVIDFMQAHFSNNRTLTLVSAPPSPDAGCMRFKARIQNVAPELLANVEFLTTDEYRERVGEETYHLETHWDLDICG